MHSVHKLTGPKKEKEKKEKKKEKEEKENKKKVIFIRSK